jgi:hypothetical protein
MTKKTLPVGTKKSYITTTFDVSGLHWFPGAGSSADFDDVSFLAWMHRHKFIFEVMVDVRHDERDVEFLQFQTICKGGVYNMDGAYKDANREPTNVYSVDVVFGPKSCETIGSELIDYILKYYGDRFNVVQVKVSEDGENSAIVRWTKD